MKIVISFSMNIVSPGVKWPGVKLTIHLHLAEVNKDGAIPPLPYVFMA
jgi:hypothetical protein